MNNLSKSLQISSVLAVLLVGSAVAIGCTDDPSDPVTPGADGGPDVVTTDAATSSCDFGEPNDTRDQAKAIDVNKLYEGLCVSNDDKSDELDFFVVTAPATGVAGGFIEISVANVKNDGLAEVIVTSALDNGVILDSYSTEPGASVNGWFTVAPGAKYNVQVNRFGGAGTRYAYDLTAKYTAINDAFEPNQTRETAKPITVGTAIKASAAVTIAAATIVPNGTDDLDFYKVTLAAGDATVKLTNGMEGYLCDVIVLDSSGVSVG